MIIRVQISNNVCNYNKDLVLRKALDEQKILLMWFEFKGRKI